jgi:hypothetical protein
MIWNALSIFVHEIGSKAKSPMFSNIGWERLNCLKNNSYLPIFLKIPAHIESFSASGQIFSSNFCIRNYGVHHRVDQEFLGFEVGSLSVSKLIIARRDDTARLRSRR